MAQTRTEPLMSSPPRPRAAPHHEPHDVRGGGSRRLAADARSGAAPTTRPASTASSSPTTSCTARTSRPTATPKLGGTKGGKQPTGPDGHWLEPLTVAVGRRRHHDARPARHQHPARRAAPPGRAVEDAVDARRAVRRPPRPRRRRRLAARGVRGRRARVRRAAASCSTTRSRCCQTLWREPDGRLLRPP